jgi:glycosyltransferase involved in cell wall biosynthesis
VADVTADVPPTPGEHIALFAPVLNDSGVAKVMTTLADAFAARGYRVDLVVGRIENNGTHRLLGGANMVQVAQSSLARGWFDAARADPGGIGTLIHAVVRSGKPGSRLRYLPGLITYLQTVRPTVVVSAGTVANLMALWARDLAGVSTWVVACEHNNLSGKVRGGRVRGTGRLRVVARLVGRVYDRADSIVAVSDGVADDLAVVAGLSRERIATIPNPVVTPDLLASARAPLEHPWFAPGEPPVLLGVGRLVPAKDFATLLKAFAQVRAARGARLLILGEGAERAALEALADELGIGTDVAFPGYVANPYAYMSRAAAFVLSSRWEGLVSVLIEAMACGCPVVSTDCPSGPFEILNGGALGPLVPVGDHAALGVAICATLDGPSDPSRLRARARAFSLETSAVRYLEEINGAR